MKVGELIKYLEGFDHDLQVMTFVPDINLDEIISASVEKVYDHKWDKHMVGRYEELYKGNKLLEQGEGFDALILLTYSND